MRYIDSVPVLRHVHSEAIKSPQLVEHYNIAVDTDSELLSGEQVIHVGVADVESPKGIIFVPSSWSDYSSRPFQELRLGVMAKYSGMRVIGLDYPGMGDFEGGRGDELSENQLQEARNGRMQSLVGNYWAALDQAELLTDESQNKLPFAFWGNSLSSLTASEMLASAPEGHSITDVHLSEIMALEKMLTARLAARFAIKGSKDLDVYLAMNSSLPEYESSGLDGLKKQVLAQKQSHWAAVATLAKGRQTDVIKEAFMSGRLDLDKEHGTTLHVVSAEFGLTKAGKVDQFLNYLTSNRIFTRQDRLTGEGHGYQDSLPAVIDQLGYLTLLPAKN